MDEERKELELQMGRLALQDLIQRLKELQEKPPCFAMAAATDALSSVEKLVRNHSNFDEEDIVNALGVMSVALFNAGTNIEAKVEYVED